MRQLVELGKNEAKFKKANAEVIAVFREEDDGKKGLEAIKTKTKTKYTLALDNGKKQTARYSTGRGEFTGYVIDKTGEIKSIFKGNLRTRATSDQLLKALDSLSGESGTKGSAAKGSNSK